MNIESVACIRSRILFTIKKLNHVATMSSTVCEQWSKTKKRKLLHHVCVCVWPIKLKEMSCTENFKTPVMLCEYVFLFNPSQRRGYFLAGDYHLLQELARVCFCWLQIVYSWSSGDSSELLMPEPQKRLLQGSKGATPPRLLSCS